ncbi:calcitonin gene-related peptide type 1 receptor-like isoform X2 [Argiope bruennichi]|uniref:calcitonin gene-related peptide type 1 receptor-like isoform X2 n=1 Tax=Argiope bruennichi TaxID=94029 RepID=UPI0024951DDB|nr:calcitonin gene-related peptide type 1 receptor-like isoform X2 [Argiope bruennichi]
MLQYQVSISAILGENLTEVVPKCRTERGFGLNFEDYKLDTCARCYVYLPSFAFVSPERKLRYNPNTGLLYDMSTNTSCVADPDNTSHPVYDTFQSDLFARKWIACCRAAIECCRKMQTDPQPPEGTKYCPRTWDGWQCWSDTKAGETASSPCQEHVYFRSEPSTCPKYAEKKCWENGTWYINERNKEWSNYSGCGRVERMRRLQHFHIATYAISILFLLPALFIFSTYKQLQVHRITMHKNLFIALLINAALVISFKTIVILDELDNSGNRRTILEENWIGCRLLYILTKYSRMCTYMWMFCEGFYLHKLIAAAFAEQKSLYMFYFIGWIFPIFPVGTVALLRWYFADEQCWAVPVKPYEWVANSLNLLSLFLNLVFLINIIRVLWTKLRATHANEPSQFRKAVRATLVLVPLFGLHFILVMYRPQNGDCFVLEGYSYFSYAMDGLQGLLVSLIFCYLNGEVIDLIRRSIDRFRLRYSLDVHPSSFTTTSELSMGRSRHSTDCGAEYSVRPWRRSTKGCNNSLDPPTELNTLTNVPKAENSMETSLIIH